MDLLFILKLAIVIFFLIMFIRGSRLVWGIGLLTVTTAFLLDTFLAIFGAEAVASESGFFADVIGGALFAGAAIWLWGLLRPLTARNQAQMPAAPGREGAEETAVWRHSERKPPDDSQTVSDRQMLYRQIRYRLGPDDVFDLIFDLQMNENDVVMPQQDIGQSVIHLMDLAAERGKVGDLALAVERILTPLPPENLPRLEKLHVESPPTVLRHYLLAHYDLSQLESMTRQLEIDWEQLGGTGKKEKVRNLLLYLYRRNRLADLLFLLQGENQA